MNYQDLDKYSLWEIKEALLRFQEDYPACYKSFFLDELKRIHEEPVSPYNPFYDRTFQRVSEEDLKYLQGEPAPLVITIPVKIEK